MKRILLSNRARFTPTSPIRKLAKYANQAKEKGVKVYHFNIGQPDIASPSVFYNAMKDLRGIAVNVNQIARKANSLNFIDVPQYKKISKELNKFMLEIKEKFLIDRKK